MNKIHIGYHKTGTTFLQRLIFPSIDNYKGRLYTGRGSDCNFRKFLHKEPFKICQRIIKHFEQQRDVFISSEWFLRIRHKQLFQLLNDNWDVLVVTRNFDDLIRSRRQHSSPNFFLNKKIQDGIIDDQIIQYYNVDNLKKGIKNLTILSFEKMFAGDKDELLRLSKFVGQDITKVFLANINNKVNAAKPQKV